MFYSFRENNTQLALCKVLLQVVHFNSDPAVSAMVIVQMVQSVLTAFTDPVVKQLALSCLVKLFYTHHDDLDLRDATRSIMASYQTSADVELQQRSNEYMFFMEGKMGNLALEKQLFLDT